MALYVPPNEEYEDEGVTSSDDSCEIQQQINDDEVEGETTVCHQNDDKDESDLFPFTAKEKSFGIDLDIFGRFAPQKVPKKYGKPIYHHHTEPSIADLKFIWHEMQCKELLVKHMDSEHTMMQFVGDEVHKTPYNLITRRCIWPVALQNSMYEQVAFKYRLEDMKKYFKWCIVLAMGGKFSIAIYHGDQCTFHKCERAYVVRGNRNGKREANYLSNKTKTKHRSGGSWQRGWNEKHLRENIQETLSVAQQDIMSCHRVFVHAPSACNASIIFGDKREQQFLYPENEDLSRQRLQQVCANRMKEKANKYRLCRRDSRIMSVPITVYQATFAENQRIHHWLSTCWLNTEMS